MIKEKLIQKFKEEHLEFPDNIEKATQFINFRCIKHNIDFYTTPVELLRKRKTSVCKKCIIENKYKELNIIDIFVVKGRTKLKIKCSKCNKEYIVNLSSKNKKCTHCNSWSKERLIKEGRKLYGDRYDYSEVSEIVKGEVKVKIKCTICGNSFMQTPLNHIKGKGGCQYCNGGRKYTTEEILSKLKSFNFDTTKVKYNGIFEKIILGCPKCGKYWKAIPNNILHNQHGCPNCVSTESKGEKLIKNYLERNNIAYVQHKSFDDLKDKKKLSYDFYIKKKNLLIEYNGAQHYDENSFSKLRKKFLLQKHHDWLKRKYAIKNNYNLLVIPYWDFKHIEEILKNTLMEN